jgi:glycosyltransferase involved in cell wall biosynthesis
MNKILIIVPAYNESKNIDKLLNSLSRTEYDVCVINDDSTDNTSEVCQKFKFCTVIDLPFNLGIGGAVQTGYLYAYKNKYDIAIQMDGDGQHDCRYINDLLSPIINKKVDMVIGSRFLESKGFQSSFLRRIGIRYFSVITRILTGKNITDTTSGFRAINSKLINVFAFDYPRDYPETETNILTLLKGYRVIEVPVIMNKRQEGKSSISSLKSIWFMVKVSLAIFIDLFKSHKKVLNNA